MNDMEMAAQLKKPFGEAGKVVGANLYLTNRVYIESVIDLMEIRPNDNILEIGPGTGLHLHYLLDKAKNLHYTGIDLSELMVEEANKLNHELLKDEAIGFRVGSSENLAFADNSFDKVITLNTLYFIDDLPLHLKEAYRVLKPHGFFYLSFFTKNFLKKLSFAKDFCMYEQADVIRTLAENRFTIEDVRLTTEKSAGVTGDDMDKESVFIITSKK